MIKYYWSKILQKSGIANRIYPLFRNRFPVANLLPEKDAMRILFSCSNANGSALSRRICCANKWKYDLDIIVPVYKAEKYIRKCLDSILNYPYDYKIRILCVDDGSPDNCPKILDEYQMDSGVVVIHQSNKGLSGARNAALERLEAQYVTFIDSDDYIDAAVLNKAIKFAMDNSFDIVQCGYTTISSDEKRVLSKAQGQQISCGGCSGYPWGKLYSSRIFESIRFPEGYWFEDTVLSQLILLNHDLRVGGV